MAWEIVVSNIFDTLWALVKGGILGILLAVLIYNLVSHFLGWKIGRVRYLVLTLWLFTLPMACGAVLVLSAAERATGEVIESETANTTRVLGERVGNPILMIALSSSGADGGAGATEDETLRVPLAYLVSARRVISESLEQLHTELTIEIEAEDEGVAKALRLWVVDTAFEHVITKNASRRLLVVDQFLTALEAVKSDDGTVGSGEFAHVIGDKYLRPEIHSFSASIFGGMRLYVYLILLGLILLPILASEVWGRYRPTTAAPVDEIGHGAIQ
jgi:hypothetical protein